jgi:hypothetical protein
MYLLARLIDWLQLPALIKPFRIYDKQVGRAVELRTSRHYSILTIGANEYYFVRETGKFDGMLERSTD